MKRNKIASITLYVLVLVFFAMIFAYVVLSNMVTMNNKQKISDLTEYERNILTKNANLNLEYNLKLNSDGFGFKDNRKCPDIIHDDGNGIINTITTNIFIENISGVDKFYCKSNTVDLKLEFSKYNSLSKEERKTVDSFFVNDSSGKIFNNLIYNGNTISISGNPVSYGANETFNIQTTIGTDGLDDNLNDDDFQVNATYPNIDNDIESRTSIIGVILDSKSKVNIFANDEKSNKFIEKNTKNIIPIKKITDAGIGNIKIKVELSEDINPEPTFEIIQIPKNSANTQNSQTNISLNLEKEINYEFDFANNYYWIFLESGEDLKGISYKLTAFTNSGERLYINPIDDSIDGIVEVYQNYVFNHAGTNVIKGGVFSMKKNLVQNLQEDNDSNCENPVRIKPNGVTLYVLDCAIAGQEYMFEGENYYVAKGGNLSVNDIRSKISSGFPANRIITTKVTNMERLFSFPQWTPGKTFNQDISSWNTSNVTNMRYTFTGMEEFNQNINSWDISKVKYMLGTFVRTKKFNQPLNNWNTQNVTDMRDMFALNPVFNQDISSWNTSSATTMWHMFTGTSSFNQNLSSWNVSSVTNMESMFHLTSLSRDNYDAILNSWSSQNVKTGVKFSGGNSKYCNGEAARNKLINDKGWIITDGGKQCN